MYIKIYFGNKPIYLCNEVDVLVSGLIHQPDALFIDELSNPAIKSVIQKISTEDFQVGIIWNEDFEKLKKAFFKEFTMITAAGGVVENEQGEVLLIFRRGKWDLPKGKLDNGETIEQCALREVMEETGLSNLLLKNALTITYHTYYEYGKHFLKDSHWYQMKINGQQPVTPQIEEDISEVKWVQKKELQQFLNNTFPSIRDVLEMI